MMVSEMLERAQEEAPFPVRQGVFVAVAGPSGGGKDSVMAYARERLDGCENDIVFTRRIITRPMEPGGEEHDTLDEAAFEREKEAGNFAVSWRANGLCYALPASVDEAMRAGRVVVANVSRAVLPEIRGRYAHVLPIIITAPREILSERLARRGRESREEVLARLTRGEARELAVPGALVIDNSGALLNAGERFLRALRKAAAWSDVCEMI